MLLVVACELAAMPLLLRAIAKIEDLPGLGGRYLALLDGILLYLVMLMALGHFKLKALTARIASIVTFLLSLSGIIVAFLMIFVALELIMLMLAMFLAAPWGTLAYLAAFGRFPKDEAIALLTLIMVLKLTFLVMLALADLGNLKNKGMLILVGLSLLATWLTSFLISLPPSFLASITDAVGALITAIIAFVILIVVFVTSILAIIKAVLSLRARAREV
jgi:hypothetical protein